MGAVRVGIGGWTYEPWRETFYPPKLPKARELEHAASRVTAIEINSTFYSRQKPESWRKWRDTVPDGFVFTAKASRYCTNRRVLAEAAESIETFVAQGIAELGGKLGPILWQLANTKKFDADDIAGFFKLLPESADGIRLRHAVEVNHESFDAPEFRRLARDHNVAIVGGDSAGQAPFGEPTADFAYIRLRNARSEEPTGYSAEELDHWAAIARTWAKQGDVFLFMINGAKERAPAAAEAMIERVGRP